MWDSHRFFSAELQLALAYCSRYDQLEDSASAHAPLLPTAFVTSLHKRVEEALERAHLEGPESPFAAYLNPQLLTSSGATQKAALGLYLVFHDIPTAGQIALARGELTKLSAVGLSRSVKVPLLSLLLPRTSPQAILRIAKSL